MKQFKPYSEMTEAQLLARLALFRSTLTMPLFSDAYKGPAWRSGPPAGFKGPSGYMGPFGQWATAEQAGARREDEIDARETAEKGIVEIEAELARRKEAQGDNKEEGK